MIDWELWHSTRELAHTGSYKLAAKRMAVNPTTIKRRKETLEERVGRTLFVREQGKMIPTPAFVVALKKVENAAQYLQEAESGLNPTTGETTWRRIVITSVPFVCDKLLSPAVHKMTDVRRLRIELSGKDQNLELTGNREADIALRLGPIRNKGIQALHAANIPYSTFSCAETSRKKDIPWVTIDRSYSHLPEARLPEEHSGECRDQIYRNLYNRDSEHHNVRSCKRPVAELCWGSVSRACQIHRPSNGHKAPMGHVARRCPGTTAFSINHSMDIGSCQ